MKRPSQLSAIIAPINGKKYAKLVKTWNKIVASSFEYANFPVRYSTSTAMQCNEKGKETQKKIDKMNEKCAKLSNYRSSAGNVRLKSKMTLNTHFACHSSWIVHRIHCKWWKPPISDISASAKRKSFNNLEEREKNVQKQEIRIY